MRSQEQDEELILRAGAGEIRAFHELHRRYRAAIYGYLRRRLGSPTLAEDVCQEVFVGLLHAAKSWEPRAKVSTLIYRIAINQAAKALRRRRTSSLDAETEPTCSPSPEKEAAMAERARRVRRAIDALDSDQRDVLLLNHYQGLSYAEVAEALDIPIGTVRSRIFRAKTALREALRDLLAQEGAQA